MAQVDTMTKVAPAMAISSQVNPSTRSLDEKKRAQERQRREQLQRQRALARTQQKLQDLEQKQQFLSSELQKHQLKQASRRPQQQDDWELQQMQRQIDTVRDQAQQTRLEMARLQQDIQTEAAAPVSPAAKASPPQKNVVTAKPTASPNLQQPPPAAAAASRQNAASVASSMTTTTTTTTKEDPPATSVTPKTKANTATTTTQKSTPTTTTTPSTPVQIQRQLARAQQKRLDLQAKRQYLQTDLRKCKLKVTGSAVENEQVLRQIQRQLEALQVEWRQVGADIQRLEQQQQQGGGTTTTTQQQRRPSTTKQPTDSPQTTGKKVSPGSPPRASESPTTPLNTAQVLTNRIKQQTPSPRSSLTNIKLDERKDLELERLLAQRQHKIQQLEAKLQFLETDRRKLELKLDHQRQQQKGMAKYIAENEESLTLIQEQTKNVQMEMDCVKADVPTLTREIAKRREVAKNTPKQPPTPAKSQTKALTAEQARFHAEKRAAAEAKRHQLAQERQKAWAAAREVEQDKKRAFLEREQRKQEMSRRVQARAAQVQAAASGESWSHGLEETVDSLFVNKKKATGTSDNESHASSETDGFRDETKSEELSSSEEFVQQNDAAIPPNATSKEETVNDDTEAATKKSPVKGQDSNSGKLDEAETQSPRGNDGTANVPSNEPDEKKADDVVSPPPAVPKMEEEEEEEDLERKAALRQGILLQWALQPPHMQSLRPVDQLLQTIQCVFPPANDLGEHDYFTKWKPISSLNDATGENKQKALTKAVRKLRFFLHPDRLPRDLSHDQDFACRLLWDITSDAWEDYQKAKEELDWI